MDAYESDPAEESQATQMLQELLENQSSPSKNPSETRNSVLQAQLVHPNDVSSDSLPSSRGSNAIPQYQFHGLASTQTQSQQYGEDEDLNEGSQKENIGTSKLSKDLGRSNRSRSGSPQSLPSRNVPRKANQAEGRASSGAGNDQVTNKKFSTNVAFQPPHTKAGPSSPSKPVTRQSPYKPTVQAPTRYKPPPRPVSPSSQDSFACDPDNTEEFFLAKSEKFAVPLSELGQGSSPVRDPGITGGSSTSSMFAYPTPSRKTRVSSPPRGRVLVEATPSNSSQSQSQSQNEPQVACHQLEATQITEGPELENQQGLNLMQVDRDGDGSGSGYESSEPSSSYGRFLRGEPDPDPTPAPSMEATQPSTQPDDSHMLEAGTGQTHPTTAAGPSTGPRSLISMLAPEKRYRYRNLINDAPVTPSVQLSSRPMGPPTPQTPYLPSAVQETQPSTQPSFPVQRVETPSSSKASSSKNAFPTQTSPRGSSPLPVDMDIVPDSEPLRHDPAPPSKMRNPASAAKHPRTAVVNLNKDHRRHKPGINEDVEMTSAHPHLEPIPAEIDDEEEEDIPLAATARKKRGRPRKDGNKGKGKAAEEETVAPVKISAPGKSGGVMAPPTQGRRGNPATARGQKSAPASGPSKATGGSWETGVVPSSVPEQDIPNASRNNSTRSSNPLDLKKTVPKKAPGSRQSSRSTSTAPKSGLRQQASTEESEDDMPLTRQGDKDDDTELADEEYQEEYEDEDAPGPSRKRKRAATNKPAAAGKGTRGAQKRIKREAPTPAAGTRQVKRLRSAASTATRSKNPQATRVFALWKQDGHYYPGTVHAMDGKSKYDVKFDDGTTGTVTLEQMRLCQLQVGDDVLFGARTRPARVAAVVQNDVDNYVKVNVDDRIEEVVISDLRIAHKTVTYAWKDRLLEPESVVSTLKPAKTNKLSPSPSKMSVASLPSVHGNRKKLLGKTGLIVTLSAANGNWEKEKEKVMNAVKNSGGFVIDDLSTIIRMEGKHSANNNRWVIKKEDVQWVGHEEIERLFVLADDPNQKPKFLIALALGIPCLATSWLHESVDCDEEKDWLGHMLPQGYSSVLGARPSQQVDVDWGNSVHQLKDIMSNSVACKLFADKSILCVGPEMVCQPKGKRRAGTDDKAQEAMNAIPQIILAMGAATVEAVTEPRYATLNLSKYDYLVIREANQYLPQFSECVTVHWSWVKESLIASRYLTLPSWNAEYSQET